MFIEQRITVSANLFLKQTKMSLKRMSVSEKMEKIFLEVPVDDLGRPLMRLKRCSYCKFNLFVQAPQGLCCSRNMHNTLVYGDHKCLSDELWA